MARKADFNAEEWATIVEGPVLAGLLVVSADRGGTIRESLAIGRVYAEARKSQGQSELLDELIASPPSLDPRRLQEQGDLRTAARERLGDGLRLLREKGGPEEVDAYKRFVTDVARAAAEAHKEGGFIGIGGKQISDAEQATLTELTELLESEEAQTG